MKSMKIKPNRRKNKIEIQRIYKSAGQPDSGQIKSWVNAALEGITQDQSCVVRIVDCKESADLNQQFRHKQGPTNVLSFPFELPDGFETIDDTGLNILGDLVICAPVLEKEALEQHKTLANHWAHIVIHGVLHLVGYDHIDEEEAEQMESKEIAILDSLHINNPYYEVTDR